MANAVCIPNKEEIFVGQSFFNIRLDTNRDTTGVIDQKIQYMKPDNTLGEWQGTLDGTEVVYEVQPGDIDMEGDWWIRAYILSGLREGYGSYVKMFVKCNPNKTA